MVKISKSKKIELARKKAEQIRLKKQAEKKKQIILVSVIVGVIVLAVVALIIGLVVHTQSLPPDYTKSQGIETDKANLKKVPHPDNIADDGGIMVSKNGFNNPVAGAVKVDNFSDFGCIACRSVDTQIKKDIDNYVAEGKINFVLHPVATPWLARAFSDNYTYRITAAAYYIYQNDPEHFLDFFYGVFGDESMPIDQHPDGSSAAYDFPDSKIQDFAAKVGVKSDVVKNCTNGEYMDFTKAVAAYFSGLIADDTKAGTPYFMVNDVKIPQGKDVLTVIKDTLGNN
ncbi:MAG: thioredoxin domain-containing protein [Bifidobacteriaceae bacterium]|jgi:hypothetical protein|nr:thioredoxin domain-containing protein [Bifidobacteriaceae bacterium]